MEHPIKMDDLGVPLFLETLTYFNQVNYNFSPFIPSGDVLLPTGNHGPGLLAACVAALLSFVCLGSGCHCWFLGIQKINESAETCFMAQRQFYHFDMFWHMHDSMHFLMQQDAIMCLI